MSKALKITFIVIASILVLLALGLGLGLGLRQNEQPETEVLTLNVDGDNVRRIQLEPGDNVYSYITENVTEYTDYNTCGWFIEDTLTMPLTEDTTIAEDENITIYTRTATLDKLSFTLNDDETTYSVSASREDISGEIVVPRMYTDESTSGLVTEVADNGFNISNGIPVSTNIDNLTMAIIPNSIQTIGTRAFYYNRSMSFINIPQGVTTIGDEAYRSCYSVNSITIPSTVESIGTNSLRLTCLAEVYNYSSFNIELGSTENGYAGYYAKVVYNAGDLTNGKPESRVNTIDNMNYYIYEDDFIALAPTVSRAEVKDIVLNENTTEINRNAFYYCTALETINIPDSVQSIGSYAFYHCDSLASPIVIPEGVTSIEAYTFNNCLNLPAVTIPDSVQSIGNFAFVNCLSMWSIIIPQNATSIGNNAFDGGIIEVYNYSDLVIEEDSSDNGGLGQSAKVIYNSEDLQEGRPETRIQVINGVQYYVYEDDFIALGPKTSPNHLRNDVLSVDLADNTTEIIDYAFYYCENLSEITIPNTVKSLGFAALSRCNFISIVIPEGVETLGEGLFNVNENLVEVTIPNTVTTMGDAVFLNCPNLKIVNVSESLTEIPARTFGSAHIESIIIPESVKNIVSGAFENCSGLATVTINSGEIYVAATSNTTCGNLLRYATTVRVLASIVDNPENTNTWLNGSAWTKSESAEGGYYTYTREI